MSSESDSDESGSDWGREHGATMMQKTPSSRGRRKKMGDISESGSDWERDRRARPRQVNRDSSSTSMRRASRIRAASRHRSTKHDVRSLSDSPPVPSLSPVQFRSLISQAARRRVSLRDEPASSPRIVRRRRLILDSEDESGLDGPARDTSDTDIEIVVDIPIKATPSTADDDALDLFMYD